MSDRIGLVDARTVSRAVSDADSNKVLRISERHESVSVKPHGLFSRAIRFISGPTARDLKENEAIRNAFVAQMKKEFGPDIAKQALIQTGFLREAPDGRHQYYKHRPLTEGMAQRALDSASTLQTQKWNADIGTRLEAIDPGPAGPEMTHGRMVRDFTAAASSIDVGANRPPRMDEHVEALERGVAAASPDELRECRQAYGELRGKMDEFMRWMANTANVESNGKAIELLKDIQDLSQTINQTGVMDARSADGDRYGFTPILIATHACIAGLEPGEAAKLMKSMNSEHSNGHRLMLGLEVMIRGLDKSLDALRAEGPARNDRPAFVLHGAMNRRQESDMAQRFNQQRAAASYSLPPAASARADGLVSAFRNVFTELEQKSVGDGEASLYVGYMNLGQQLNGRLQGSDTRSQAATFAYEASSSLGLSLRTGIVQ